MKTRRSILSLIFGAAAAPAAIAVAKAMPVAPSTDLWGTAARSPVGTVLRIRLPKDYRIFDRTQLDMNPARMVTLDDWARIMCQSNQFNPFTGDGND